MSFDKGRYVSACFTILYEM